MFRDFRRFLRSVRREWPYWGLAVLILGVAIGATATAYSLIDGLVLHPLPLPDQGRIVLIGGLTSERLPTADPVAWWGKAHSLQYLAFYDEGAAHVQAGDWRGTVTTAVVSREYFRVYGVRPARGRDFGREDEVPGQNRVAILSYAFWRSRSVGQPLPLGSNVLLNGTQYTVVGIAPKSLDGLDVDLWVPRCLKAAGSLKLSSSQDPSVKYYSGWVGRLRRAATIAQARQELMDLLNRLNTSFTPRTRMSYGESINVGSLVDAAASLYGRALEALLAGAALLLLMAATDCCGFLMARAARRAKEASIRQVLGASRLSILRHALVEAAGLGLLGGAAGALVARAMLFACQGAFPIYFVHLRDRAFLGPQVSFGCLLLGVLVGVLVGLLPGLRIASRRNFEALKEFSGPLLGSRGRWLRWGLVVLQVAFTFALLMGAALTVETARRLFGSGKGYTIGGVFAVHLSVPGRSAPGARGWTPSREPARRQENRVSAGRPAPSAASADHAQTGQSLYAEQAEILAAAAGMPEVSAEGLTDRLPIRPAPWGSYIGGWGQGNMFSWGGDVSGDYFRVLKMRFLAGHTFTSPLAHEIVIEQRVAEGLWPGKSPLGRTVVLMGGSEEESDTVVGVVNDTRSVQIDGPAKGHFYLPLGRLRPSGQTGWSAFLLLRCRVRCGNLTPALLAALGKVGADSYVDGYAALAHYSRVISEPLSMRTWLLSFYAVIGLALALGGVFVLSSYLSAMRRHDTGIRMVLGAGRADLVWQIAREGIVSALVGVAAGGLLWLSTAPVVRDLIYGVTPLNPVVLGAVGALLFAVACVASILPALAAVARQNPADLLRVL